MTCRNDDLCSPLICESAEIKIKSKRCIITIDNIFIYRCPDCDKIKYAAEDLKLVQQIRSLIRDPQLDPCKRADISQGSFVDIVLKQDQSTGKLTRGHVAKILTNKPYHPRGIKVILVENNAVGRVSYIIEK